MKEGFYSGPAGLRIHDLLRCTSYTHMALEAFMNRISSSSGWEARKGPDTEDSSLMGGPSPLQVSLNRCHHEYSDDMAADSRSKYIPHPCM